MVSARGGRPLGPLAYGRRTSAMIRSTSSASGRLYSGTGQGARDGHRRHRQGLPRRHRQRRGRPPRTRTTRPRTTSGSLDRPLVTQEMVDAAAGGRAVLPLPRARYRHRALRRARPSDIGLPYADGVDNDGDGAVDEGIDEGIDEMIDERRDDGIDNDGDWRVALDDVGLDGAAGTGDVGENDGRPYLGRRHRPPRRSPTSTPPTSPRATRSASPTCATVPGRQLQRLPAPTARFSSNYMIPGQFALATGTGNQDDRDLVVSSGLFPLRAGQTERVSFAVVFGDVDYPITGPETRSATSSKTARNAAGSLRGRLPLRPGARLPDGQRRARRRRGDALLGPRRRGLVRLLYRRPRRAPASTRATSRATKSTVPPTRPFWTRARSRTASATLRSSGRIAQFDLIDGIGGFQEVAVNGIQYYLGDDTRQRRRSLERAPSTRTPTPRPSTASSYFYAVTSYDFGAPSADIPPTECSIVIATGPDGEVQRLGPNVVQRSRPRRAAAGYVEGDGWGGRTRAGLLHRRASPTTMVDPTAHQRRGSLPRGVRRHARSCATAGQDTLRTESFSLLDVTGGVASADTHHRAAAPSFRDGRRGCPIVDGFQHQHRSASQHPETPTPSPFAPSRLCRSPSTRLTELGRRRPSTSSSIDAIRRKRQLSEDGTRSPFDYQIEVVAPGAGRRVVPVLLRLFGRRHPNRLSLAQADQRSS